MNRFEEINCPSCNNSDFVIWAKSKTPARYVKCRICGTIYASPRPTIEARRTWINDAFTLSREWEVAMEARRGALGLGSAFIKRYITKGRMLDIGCSTGLFFEFFPSERWERYGVELSPSTAEYARRSHRADVRVGDLRTANFPAQSFDLVTLIDTICLLDDPYQDICESRRILRTGGFVAIELPGLAYISQRIRGILPLLLNGNWIQVDPASSYTYWPSPQSLKLLLQRCGFEPVGWCVIPSPRRDSLADLFSNVHYKVAVFLSRLHPHFLTWAPKYLFLARRN